jgi:hypothetical protein
MGSQLTITSPPPYVFVSVASKGLMFHVIGIGEEWSKLRFELLPGVVEFFSGRELP